MAILWVHCQRVKTALQSICTRHDKSVKVLPLAVRARGGMADTPDLGFRLWCLRRASQGFTQQLPNPHGYWLESLLSLKTRTTDGVWRHVDLRQRSVAKSVARPARE